MRMLRMRSGHWVGHGPILHESARKMTVTKRMREKRRIVEEVDEANEESRSRGGEDELIESHDGNGNGEKHGSGVMKLQCLMGTSQGMKDQMKKNRFHWKVSRINRKSEKSYDNDKKEIMYFEFNPAVES